MMGRCGASTGLPRIEPPKYAVVLVRERGSQLVKQMQGRSVQISLTATLSRELAALRVRDLGARKGISRLGLGVDRDLQAETRQSRHGGADGNCTCSSSRLATWVVGVFVLDFGTIMYLPHGERVLSRHD